MMAAWPGVGLADGPSPAAKRLTDQLTAEQKAYEKARKQAKDKLVSALRTAESEAVQADPTALGQQKRKALQAEREALTKNDTLPTSDEALGGLYAYLTGLHEARAKVRKAGDKLIEQLAKDGDAAGEAKAKAEMAKLTAAVPGLDKLAAGSRWQGTLQKTVVGRNANNTSCNFTVQALGENTITAVVALDNNWCKMKMEGLRDGPYFVLRVKQKVIGDAGEPVFTGFVCGERLVLGAARIRQVVRKQPVLINGFAALTRQ
jgi:hypothetical protein